MPVEPIEWTVTEFVLVHSLLGRTTHRVLARFPLISPLSAERGT
jgi:RNA 2',3'-cyclic 3'-phosphodiesterase